MKKLLALTAISLPALIAGASQRLVPVSTFNTQIIMEWTPRRPRR